jgi:hypothetical protein
VWTDPDYQPTAYIQDVTPSSSNSDFELPSLDHLPSVNRPASGGGRHSGGVPRENNW